MGSSLGFDRMSCFCSGAAGRIPAVAAQTALVRSGFHVLFTSSITSLSFSPKSPSVLFVALNFFSHLKLYKLQSASKVTMFKMFLHISV